MLDSLELCGLMCRCCVRVNFAKGSSGEAVLTTDCLVWGSQIHISTDNKTSSPAKSGASMDTRHNHMDSD